GEAAAALDDPDSLGGHVLGDVVGLGRREGLDAGVERGGVHAEARVLPVFQLQPEGCGAAQRGHGHRRLDERLGRHAVSQDAGTAETVGVNNGYVRPELGGDKSGLVASWTPAKYRDPRTWQSHVYLVSRIKNPR